MTTEERQVSNGFWNGRLSRSGYIGRSVLGLLLGSVLNVITSRTADSGNADGPLLLIAFVLTVGLAVWQCSVTCRRINDIRASCWLVVLLFVPILNLGLFAWLACAKGRENRMAERKAEVEWIQEKMNGK